MIFPKMLAAAFFAACVIAGAHPADAQQPYGQPPQPDKQHPAPARPPVVTPAHPQPVPHVQPGAGARVAPGIGARLPGYGAPPANGAPPTPRLGSITRPPQGTNAPPGFVRRIAPGSTTAGSPGAAAPYFRPIPHAPGTAATVQHPGVAAGTAGRAATASLAHPYGVAPGWHGDARVFHPGAGGAAITRPVPTFAAGTTVFRSAPTHWHEFMRGTAPVFDAAGAATFAHAHEHDFHVDDVRFFTVQERELWRRGIWHNGWHDGHWGWWWVVGEVWYPYPAPLYPYPVMVAPLIVADAVVVPGAPQGAPPPPAPPGAPPPSELSSEIPPLPAPPQVTYECHNPEGAFPDVQACGQEWSAAPLSATAMQ